MNTRVARVPGDTLYLHRIDEDQLEGMSQDGVVMELRHAYSTGFQDGTRGAVDDALQDEKLSLDLLRAYRAGRLSGWREQHPGKEPPLELAL